MYHWPAIGINIILLPWACGIWRQAGGRSSEELAGWRDPRPSSEPFAQPKVAANGVERQQRQLDKFYTSYSNIFTIRRPTPERRALGHSVIELTSFAWLGQDKTRAACLELGTSPLWAAPLEFILWLPGQTCQLCPRKYISSEALDMRVGFQLRSSLQGDADQKCWLRIYSEKRNLNLVNYIYHS